MKWFALVLALLVPWPPSQATLAEAARQARDAWLAHDAQALVGHSPSIVLQIPGADPSSPLGHAQAVELLRRHLQSAHERGLTIGAVRELEGGRGFVELARRYVVRGTVEERRETVFLGFRRIGGRWGLSEVRSTT